MSYLDKLKDYEFTYEYQSKGDIYVYTRAYETVIALDYGDAVEIFERRTNRKIDHDLVRILDIKIVNNRDDKNS